MVGLCSTRQPHKAMAQILWALSLLSNLDEERINYIAGRLVFSSSSVAGRVVGVS